MPVSGTMVSAAAPRPADIASAPPARPHPARSAPPRDRSPAVRLRGLGEPHLRPTRGIAKPGRAVAAGATHGGAIGRHRHCPTSPHGSAAWCCRAARRCAGGPRTRKQRDRNRAAASTRPPSRLRSGRRGGDSHRAPCARSHPGPLRGAYRALPLLRHRNARMRFAEISLFGVYVAPISLMMVGAWLITIALRRVANRFGLLRYVWHPALFVFAVYVIVLSSWALIVAR